MTMALCLNCGELKADALCACPNCAAESTGNIQIDIAFSEHTLTYDTLEQFGAVIREIHGHCPDGTTCFHAFMEYLSRHHPHILTVELTDEARARAADVLGQCSLPAVDVKRRRVSGRRGESHRQYD